MLDIHLAHRFSHFARAAVGISTVSPGTPDEALHEVFGGILGILEDDHVTALRLAEPGQSLVRERDLGTVDEFVDQQEIAHLQRVFHTAARNLERFHEKVSDDGEQDDRNQKDLCPIPEESQLRAPRLSSRSASIRCAGVMNATAIPHRSRW